ncbi:hypothetical protein QCA50_008020 [Cerrena zonata]|uniref:RanBP2-type domain-containing protein n=1 Tax=Cerrena zonata TaxID=2478898 RepID=A0AAW0GET6_9APHY
MPVPTALRSKGPLEHSAHVDFLVDTFQRLSIPVGGSPMSIPSSTRGSLPYWAQLDRTDSSVRSPSSASFATPQSSGILMHNSQDPFIMTRSRVLRLTVRTHFSEYTLPDCVERIKALQPTLWKSSQGGTPDVFLVFRTHEEACAAFSLSTPSFPLFPALESELEHIQNLHQVRWSHVVDEITSSTPMSRIPSYTSRQPINMGPQPTTRLANGLTPLRTESFNLSSNPPNPKLSFRAGDWMCSVRHCAAHNFGRNVACIRCGAPRALSDTECTTSPISPSHNISPRFLMTGNGQGPTPASLASNLAQLTISQHSHYPSMSQPQSPLTPLSAQMPLSAPPAPPRSYPPIPSISPASKPPSPSYPLLTPSGNTLSAGGRVRNISRDPMSPCIMYWPDNEPLPERGQIRPSGSVASQFPPIVNTGNKGAAEKQPGDWHCSKCNYLNWRRRKVCQTCFPYAEGNGDSISATVQAERITLLANVSVAPPLYWIILPLDPSRLSLRPTRLPSCLLLVEWNANFARTVLRTNSTSGKLPSVNAARSSHSSVRALGLQQHHAPTPGVFGHPNASFQIQNESKLLPSFLQDIIHSPSLSPTTSSASCSSVFDGPHYTYSSNTSLNASPDSSIGRATGTIEERRRQVYDRNNGSDLSIWRLDGDETSRIRKGLQPHYR